MSQYSRTKVYQKRLLKSGLLAGMASGGNMMEDTEREIICTVADNVLAPALNGFMVWVLNQAMAQGIRRLYFLARDGYFMYKTACRYVEAYGLPLECRYFYCSRYSVRIPCYHLDTEKALAYITLGGLDVTAERLYTRAGFDEKQKEKLFQAGVLPYERKEQIPRKELAQIKEVLSKNSLFMDMLVENSRRALPAYRKYLKQEGLLEEIPAALVDSGWVGSMQKELNCSLQRFGRKEQIHGFYWGLYELPPDVDRFRYHTYYFSPEGELRRKAAFNNCLFETIFTAPHGMTLFYEQTDEKIRPVLSEFSAGRAEGLKFIEEQFLTWQENFLGQISDTSFEMLAKAFMEKQICCAIEKNLKLFMHYPTKEEARLFGKMNFTDDVMEEKGNQIAAHLEERELTGNHLLHRVISELPLHKKSIRQSAWYEGSAAAYGKHPVYHIFQYTGYKYLLYYRKRERQCRQRKADMINASVWRMQ